MPHRNQDHHNAEQPEPSGKKAIPARANEHVEEYRLIPVDSYEYDEDREIIDVMGLLKDLWVNKKTVLLVAAIFFAIGLIAFIGSERIYYSEAKLMPESSNNRSQLGQLFQQYENILGLQAITDTEDISVSLYPYIVESIPFQLELMQHDIYFSDIDERVTIYEYFSDYHEKSFTQLASEALWNFTIGLPVTIYDFVRNWSSGPRVQEPVEFSGLENFDQPIQLDNRIRNVMAQVSKLITVDREPQTGFVSIGVALPDAQASTEMVILVRNLLQEYIIDYRTEKAMNNLQFIEEQVEDAKASFELAQNALAVHQDRNVNVNRQTVAIAEQRLQSQLDLTYTLYNTLARRLQEAKIQVQEQTPVFRIHEPATVPGRPAQPSAIRMLVGSLFVGLFFGVCTIYFRRIIKKFIAEFKTKEPKPYFS